jgi:hypothetical protein
VLFPEAVRFEKGEFGTAATCLLFKLLEKPEGDKSSLATLTKRGRSIVLIGLPRVEKVARGMARKLRMEYPRAIYYEMNRGDRREPIFRDDEDRQRAPEHAGGGLQASGLTGACPLPEGQSLSSGGGDAPGKPCGGNEERGEARAEGIVTKELKCWRWWRRCEQRRR